MAKINLTPSSTLGKCTCPECGYPDAKVGVDKKARPYRYCEDCESRYFTSTPIQARNLIKKIQPAGAIARA